MSDLISRSELIKALDKYCGSQRYLVSENIREIINNQPTAYDIGKVVKELEKESEFLKQCNYDYEGEFVPLVNAIEIVKQGGVSDDFCEWKRSGDMARNPHTFIKYNINQFDGLYALDTCQYCRKKIKVVE